MAGTLQTPSRRFTFFVVGVYSIMLLIVFRLFYLQVPRADFFADKSIKNFTRFKTIIPPRGNILDCKGRLLATNRPVVTLFWQGTGKTSLTAEQEAVLALVQELSGQLFDQETMRKIRRAERYKTIVPLVHDLPQQQLIKLLERFADCQNLEIEDTFQRYYPHKKVASHVLGYINTINQQYIGKMGLEELLQKELQGQEGRAMLVINSVGTNLYQQETYQALMGKDVSTTLDLSLQMLAEQVFSEELCGALVLMDPRTGAIKTLLSRPNFDPALFIKPIGIQQWEFLQQGQPFLNRVFTACYPPASIFKLVTMSAALEHGFVSPDDTTFCKGYTRFRSRNYHCANRFGHGLLTAKEALAHSCNIMFFDIGKRMHIDVLADYARKFGLGSKTGVLFSEKEGLVPCVAWKRRYKQESWWPGETLSCAIGQSYLLVTPIQIARMIGSIFEGMLVRPRLLEDEPMACEPLLIKHSTRTFLQESMKMVVGEGTGKLMGLVKDVQIFGKTGTAETSTSKQTTPHAWFVSYFHYKKDPLVLVIVVEHTEALKIAVRIARNYLFGYKKLIDQEFMIS
jgi:penicillin-binding protein 2